MEQTISIIIPYYQGERFIAETLSSLLQQNHPNLEIIIVNDGSSEQSLHALEAFGDKIKIISQENKGQAAARNLGIKNAQGSIIGLIDQDDLWPNNRLSNTLAHLDDAHDFVRGMTQKIHMHENGQYEMSDPTFHEELIGAALYKRHVFDIVGTFDETMREGEDFDWNIRLAESNCIEKRISDVTLLCRRHDKNQSDLKDFVKNGQMIALKKKLERMRAKK